MQKINLIYFPSTINSAKYIKSLKCIECFSQPHLSICNFHEMCRCARSIRCRCKLLIVLLTGHTDAHKTKMLRISSAAAVAEAYDAISGWLLPFSHWIHIAFRLLVFRTIDAYFFYQFHLAHTKHKHGLSWSSLIACKIWFYCWSGVAMDIMFMCALAVRWRFGFSYFSQLKITPNKPNAELLNLRFHQLENVDAWSVESWLVNCARRQWHVGDGHFLVYLISLSPCGYSTFSHVSVTISFGILIVWGSELSFSCDVTFQSFQFIAPLKISAQWLGKM